MWLVADSGSTKTEWILFNSRGKRKQIFTNGLNPLFLSEEEFKSEILTSELHLYGSKIKKLWFYGAGCEADSINRKTINMLQHVFAEAVIEVDSDLLAAARATCGTEEGMVAILGTGSNSCFYDGTQIKEQIKPLGYVLGDEGSGAALGKSLLKKLLRNQLPTKLSDSIYSDMGLDYEDIIKKVYRDKWPNRFLASCVKVIHKYKSEDEIGLIIEEEFNKFSDLLNMYDIKRPVNLIGSIGFYFKQDINNSLQKNRLQLGKVIKSPAESLVSYHLKND